MVEQTSFMQAVVNALTSDPGITLGALLGSLGILAGVVISVTSVVSYSWRCVREREELAALKHDMLERGLGAEEISRVIEASPRNGPSVRIDTRNKTWHAKC